MLKSKIPITSYVIICSIYYVIALYFFICYFQFEHYDPWMKDLMEQYLANPPIENVAEETNWPSQYNKPKIVGTLLRSSGKLMKIKSAYKRHGKYFIWGALGTKGPVAWWDTKDVCLLRNLFLDIISFVLHILVELLQRYIFGYLRTIFLRPYYFGLLK